MKSWGYSWLDCSDWSRLIYYRKWKWGEYQEDVQVQRTAKNVPKVFREQGMCFEKLVPRTLEPRHIKCKKLSEGRTAYITECTAFSDVFYWFLRLPEWKIILLPVRCNDVQNSISPPKQIRVRRIQLYSTFKHMSKQEAVYRGRMRAFRARFGCHFAKLAKAVLFCSTG